MLHSYAVRITYPQATVKHIIAVWATICEKIVAFEHTDAKKIHSHLLVIGCKVEKKQMRNIAATCGVDVKGQENMAFRVYDANTTYIVYMTKGKFSPYYLQGFTQEECEEAKQRWKPEKETRIGLLYNKLDACIDGYKSEEYLAWRNAEVDTRFRLGLRDDWNPQWEWLLKRARAIAFMDNNQFCTGRFFQDHKMLVYTYALRNYIPIPKDWKGNVL